MVSVIKKLILSVSMLTLTATALPLHAQDIVAEMKYRCEQVDGIFDEDGNCLDPIEAEGGETTIGLSDVELDDEVHIIQGIGLLSGELGGMETFTTQQEGLQICFSGLELDVRNCHQAFKNNVDYYNECIDAAGESHEQCLTWVQKLPYEELQY